MDPEYASYANAVRAFAVEHGFGEAESEATAAACAAIAEKDDAIAAAVSAVESGSLNALMAMGFLTATAIAVSWLISRGLWDEAVKYADSTTEVSDAASHD